MSARSSKQPTPPPDDSSQSTFRRLLEEVLVVPPGDRERWLDEHCADPKIRRRLERLLSDDDATDPGGMLERPSPELLAAVADEAHGSHMRPKATADRGPRPAGAEPRTDPAAAAPAPVVQDPDRRQRPSAWVAVTVFLAVVVLGFALAMRTLDAERVRLAVAEAARAREDTVALHQRLRRANEFIARSLAADLSLDDPSLVEDIRARGEAELADEPLVLAQVLDPLAQILDEIGRTDDACRLRQRSLELRRGALPADHPELLASSELAGGCAENPDP